MGFYNNLLEDELMEGKRVNPRDVVEVFEKMDKSKIQDVKTKLAELHHLHRDVFNLKNLKVRKRGDNKLEITRNMKRTYIKLIEREIAVMSIEIIKKKGKLFKLIIDPKTREKIKVPVNDFKLTIYIHDNKNNFDFFELFEESRLDWKQLVNIISSLLGDINNLEKELKKKFVKFGLS